MSIAKNIKRLLNELNLNQRELAKLASLPPSTINNALKDDSEI
ncbi:helix-turn-helix domain-containing protein, partial [Acinetobacter baumannii]